MIGLLHPQVTSREVTAGKCPSGTIWSPPSYSHGFVETSFRRPICRCGVPRGCPLRDAGAPSGKLVLTLTSAGGPGGHSPPGCGQCFRAARRTLMPRLSPGTRGRPVCVCVRVCLLRH